VINQLENRRDEVALRHGYTFDTINNYRTIEQVLARRLEVRMSHGLRAMQGL
jgi:hypothetical protein